MATIKADDRGPSWADVGTLMEHLEAQHKCLTRVQFGRKLVGRPGLVLDVEALRAKGRNDWYVITHATRYWPTHQAKTMPGLLIQALWALSEQIYEYDDLPLYRGQPEEELPLPPEA